MCILPGLDRSRPQSVHTWTDCSGELRKRVLITPIGAAEGNITVIAISGNYLVRWSYLGLRYRLQYIWLHQRDQALRGVSPLVSQDKREHIRTALYEASSLFGDLPNKLQ